MKRTASADALDSLGRLARQFGSGLAARKRALLETFAQSTLASPRLVLRLHENLVFLDAYPDDRHVRVTVQRLLRAFGDRRDLRRFRAALAGTGISGTDTPYRYFWPTARWIASQWPRALAIDRSDPDHVRAILEALPSLLEPVQAAWLRDHAKLKAGVLDRLRPRGLTDADWFIGLVEAMPGDDRFRELFFDRVDPPFILRWRIGAPERTTTRLDWLPPRFRNTPFDRRRRSLRIEARQPPRRVVALGPARANALVRLARFSMITRERDLEVFQYANASDAFLVDDGDGLGFALVGMRPERRALLPVIYGGLILQNGVPVGYVQLDVLGRHAEVSFNTFETFRGAEAGRLFTRLIATVHHVFDCDSFSIEPYQLGAANEEGIESGAWWFYHRFGFRPRDAAVRDIAARELRLRATNARHRSSPRTLRALAQSHVFYSLLPARTARLPRVRQLLAAATRELGHFPQSRVAARRADAVAVAFGRLGSRRRIPAAGVARLVHEQWAGIVLALLRHGRWSAHERRALAQLIDAKARGSERDFHRRLLAHSHLRRVLDC